MDPSLARDRALNWGTVLCLETPAGATFGIDQHAWAVGPNFKGVKMIPPGAHYISYGASDTFGASATTISFFAFIKPQQIIVKKWDTAIEDFVDIQDEDERERYADGVRRFDFDSDLGAYPIEKYRDWQALSNFITEKVVSHLQPPAKRISSAASSESAEEEKEILEQLHNFRLKNSAAKKENTQTDQNELPPLENPSEKPTPPAPTPAPTPATSKKSDLIEFCPKFTRIPRRAAEKGATPQEITQQNLDKSALLKRILETTYPQDSFMILGELQYAFATFFFGHSFEGFRQWKELLILLTNCEAALRQVVWVTDYKNASRTNVQFFGNFIELMSAQVELVPKDFFHDALSGNNFIKNIFKGFFEMLLEPGIDIALVAFGKRLKSKMEQRFQINFSVEEFENEEDAPVLVVLDE